MAKNDSINSEFVASLAGASVQPGETGFYAPAVHGAARLQVKAGDKCSDYILDTELGHGGMGTVWKAKHFQMKKFVAVKFVTADIGLNPDLLRRFKQEIETLNEVRHPNIIDILTCNWENNPPYYVMDFVSGKDLAGHIEEGELALEDIRRWLLQAAGALEAAHKKGVVHRDIKPANILVDSDGNIKVCDFGIAKTVGTEQPHHTATGAFVGTRGYASPEQRDGKAVDARTDIFSLGCVFYEMLTGERAGCPILPGEFRDNLPAEWDNLYKKMVFPKVERRLQTMGEVIASLKALPLLTAGVRTGYAASQAAAANTSDSVSAFRVEIVSVLDGFISGIETRSAAAREARNTDDALKLYDTQKTLVKQREDFLNKNVFPDISKLTEEQREILNRCYFSVADNGKEQVDNLVLDGKMDEAMELRRFLSAKEIVEGQKAEQKRLDDIAEQKRREEERKRKEEEAERIRLDDIAEQKRREEERKRKEEEAERIRLETKFSFWCRNCGAKLRAKEKAVGREVLCPNCQKPTLVEHNQKPFKFLYTGDRFVLSVKEIDYAFHWCPSGTFLMGDGNYALKVTLSKGFCMGETEVTQQQWQSVMGNNPSGFKGDDLPVERVSWEDCQAFITKLNSLANGACPVGYKFSLPTEAQWEYACRAGSTSAYCFGNDEKQLGDYAWYDGNSGYKTHPVGTKKANAWGLHDMHGNVREWCEDWFGDYPQNAVVDPTGAAYRVCRGGGWFSYAGYCRSAYRFNHEPEDRYDCQGLRLSLVPE
jgi:serine/threonine protein kinase/DNA-directed RNA polymerase subunit RPC12/RpoP